MTSTKALLVYAALMMGCSDPADTHSGPTTTDSTPGTAWPAISSVTGIKLPEGTRAAAFVVW
jgi:hypothetical protein